jgi:transposase-like protein
MGQEDSIMRKRHHTPEQIIRKLAEGDRMLNEGASVDEVARHLEITASTWHRWKNQYGGMKADNVYQRVPNRRSRVSDRAPNAAPERRWSPPWPERRTARRACLRSTCMRRVGQHEPRSVKHPSGRSRSGYRPNLRRQVEE